MRQLFKILSVAVASVIFTVTLWLAIVGCIFLFTIKPRPYSAKTCNDIVQMHNSYTGKDDIVCEVVMHSYSDIITVVGDN